MPAHTPIPDIPGIELLDPTTLTFLSARLSELCGLSSTNPKFPGSQPVSFSHESLKMLDGMDFWVCEKSDGVRVLIFVIMNGMTNEQEVWLVDRKQRFFRIQDLHFPHYEVMDSPLKETVLDGELVIDIDQKTGEHKLNYYAFDCLVLDGQNIMQKTLMSRFGRLRDWVVKPFERALTEYPEWRETLPFNIIAKKQELSYYIDQVLKVHIPALEHGHDGLIFTCVESAYTPGTDPKILKWKPPSENSIDFKLELRFPSSPHYPDEPDYTFKPAFWLHTWLGGTQHEYFDDMDIPDPEWERMKESGEQYDDRVVEVCWDGERGNWRIMRIRDDKPNANHKSIMEKILVSIEDGVEIEALLARSEGIKSAWKARAAARKGGAPQVQQQQRRPIQGGANPAPPSAGRSGGGYSSSGGYGGSASMPVMAGLKR